MHNQLRKPKQQWIEFCNLRTGVNKLFQHKIYSLWQGLGLCKINDIWHKFMQKWCIINWKNKNNNELYFIIGELEQAKYFKHKIYFILRGLGWCTINNTWRKIMHKQCILDWQNKQQWIVVYNWRTGASKILQHKIYFLMQRWCIIIDNMVHKIKHKQCIIDWQNTNNKGFCLRIVELKQAKYCFCTREWSIMPNILREEDCVQLTHNWLPNRIFLTIKGVQIDWY